MLLTSLMSSRLCHDLVNPVGALSSGLEVLREPDTDDEMRREAMALIETSAEKAITALKFARLAYGLSGGLTHEVSLAEVRELLAGVYSFAKADLEWAVDGASVPKPEAKALLLLAHAAGDCVPRGGTVRIAGALGEYEIVASGPRTMLNQDLVAALDGRASDLTPKFAPAFLVGKIARDAGGEACAELVEDRVFFRLVIPRSSLSLTAG
ncbi:MAG: histidine phosphotransferase [Alphaproteobacteria bacterium]|nr:histidine phosphotransferase [Alphaproteobacteria bacterium]